FAPWSAAVEFAEQPALPPLVCFARSRVAQEPPHGHSQPRPAAVAPPRRRDGRLRARLAPELIPGEALRGPARLGLRRPVLALPLPLHQPSRRPIGSQSLQH